MLQKTDLKSDPSPEEVFSLNYLPPTIHFREKQFSTLLARSTMTHGTYCEGDRSTGKTVTALKYTEALKEKNDHFVIYFTSKRAILLDFKQALENAIGRSLKSRQYAPHVLFEQPQQYISVILDDVQKLLLYKTFNDFIHGLFEHSLEAKKTFHLVLIGTTPYPKFIKLIYDYIESRYQFYPVLFPLYNANELSQILRDRLDIAQIKYNEGAINLISAKVRRLASDLRLGFQILKNALPLLTDGLTVPIIEQAWQKTKTDYWKNQISEMDEQTQLILLAATKVADKSEEKPPIIRTHDITEVYEKLCNERGISALYPQRVHYLLAKLVQTGWITKEGIESRGCYGVTARFRYEMTPDTILRAFEETRLKIDN